MVSLSLPLKTQKEKYLIFNEEFGLFINLITQYRYE
jgi:hypothetical protein